MNQSTCSAQYRPTKMVHYHNHPCMTSARGNAFVIPTRRTPRQALGSSKTPGQWVPDKVGVATHPHPARRFRTSGPALEFTIRSTKVRCRRKYTSTCLMQLLLFVISFMQGIYIYMPETNVFMWYSVAAILQSQLLTDIMLFHTLYLSCSYISTFRSKCAVPSMAVFLDFVLSRHVGGGSVGLHLFIPWLPSRLVSTPFGTCWYQCSLSNFTPLSLHMLKCSCTHSAMSVCTVLLPVLDMLT
jgi:hypothetical protein